MSKRKRFWEVLEAVPGLALLDVDWREDFGPSYEVARQFLRPTDKRARVYRCPSPGGDGCPRQILVHGPDDIEAVCGDVPRYCDTIRLKDRETVIYEVDMNRLARKIAIAFDLEGSLRPVPRAPQTWQIGAYEPGPGEWVPVYLALPFNENLLRRAAQALVASSRGPIVLLTATATCASAEILEPLRASSSVHLVLAKALEITAQGAFLPRITLSEHFGARGGHRVAAPMNIFRKIGEKWEIAFEGQVGHFNDRVGLFYISHLLDRPQEDVECELLKIVVAEFGETAILPGFREGIIDADAFTAIGAKQEAIEEELAEARLNADLAAMERLENEASEITRMIEQVAGLSGRIRLEASQIEAARKSVGGAVRLALKTIEAGGLPRLADHLRGSLRLGRYLRYSPDREIRWVTS